MSNNFTILLKGIYAPAYNSTFFFFLLSTFVKYRLCIALYSFKKFMLYFMLCI